MPAIPREGEADYDDLKTLESACDVNLGSEVAAYASACSSGACTLENTSGVGIDARGVATGKARRDYRRLCSAMAKIGDLDAEEHHPPMVQKDPQDAEDHPPPMVDEDPEDEAPAMPTKSAKHLPPHRQKIGPPLWLVNACVARTVGKAEIAAKPAARAAL